MDKEYVAKTLRAIEATIEPSSLSKDDKATMHDLIGKAIKYFSSQYDEVFSRSDDIEISDFISKLGNYTAVFKEAINGNTAAWKEIDAIREEITEAHK